MKHVPLLLSGQLKDIAYLEQRQSQAYTKKLSIHLHQRPRMH